MILLIDGDGEFWVRDVRCFEFLFLAGDGFCFGVCFLVEILKVAIWVVVDSCVNLV